MPLLRRELDTKNGVFPEGLSHLGCILRTGILVGKCEFHLQKGTDLDIAGASGFFDPKRCQLKI